MRTTVGTGALNAGQRHFVVVHGDLLLAGGLDAAHDVAALSGARVKESQARHLVGEVLEIKDLHGLECFRGECGDGHRHVLKALRAEFPGGHHDLLDRSFGVL